MTRRISKNLIQGKPFTHESFLKAYQEGGHSAFFDRYGYQDRTGLKPVAFYANQQWFRLIKYFDKQYLFETDLIHEHEFESYDEMLKFLKENPDMIEGLDDNIALKFNVKGSRGPARTRVGEIRKALKYV